MSNTSGGKMLLWQDDVVVDLPSYELAIRQLEFSTMDFGEGQIFHNISIIHNSIVGDYILNQFPKHIMAAHFVRKSPAGQVEPNYIHSDEAHGDLTAIFYISGNPACGTIFYEADRKTPAITVHMAAGRLIVFPSACPHSRVLYDNFGEGDESRLIEVVFLKYNP